MKAIYIILGLTAIFILASAYYLLFTRRRKVGTTAESGEDDSPVNGNVYVNENVNVVESKAKRSVKTRAASASVSNRASTAPAGESVETLARRLAEAVKTIQDIAEDPLLQRHPDLQNSIRRIAAGADRTTAAVEAEPPSPLLKPFKPQLPAENRPQVSFLGESGTPSRNESLPSAEFEAENMNRTKQKRIIPPAPAVKKRNNRAQRNGPLPPLKKIIPGTAANWNSALSDRKHSAKNASGAFLVSPVRAAPDRKTTQKELSSKAGFRATAPLPRDSKAGVKSDKHPVQTPKPLIHQNKTAVSTINATASLPKNYTSRES